MSTFELVMCFVWAVAEAVVWPFMPDAVLVPLAARHPAQAWQLIPVAIAGSAGGSLISYLIARRSESGASAWLSRLPMVRGSMIAQARLWLQTEGPRGACHQPLSFIPFKVFAFLAGQLKMPLLPFLGWAMLARGIRFVLVCSIAAVVGLLFGRWLYPVWNFALLVWIVVFGAMLRRAVQHWERKGEP